MHPPGEGLLDVNACREPPEDGLMCELLWSDPKPAAGRGPSQRGVGVGFGPDVTRNFLQDNGLDLLVRSHEVSLLLLCVMLQLLRLGLTVGTIGVLP